MSNILNAPGPLDPLDSETRDLFRKTQGNILKAHGRDAVRCFMVAFGDGPEDPLHFMRWAKTKITNADKQWLEARRFQETRERGDTFYSVALTRQAFQRLSAVPGEPVPDSPAGGWDLIFGTGLAKNWIGKLPGFDTEAQEWAGIDALVLIADDDFKQLESKVRETYEQLKPFARVVSLEAGDRMNFDDDTQIPIEHFGFVDGVSQPVFVRGSASGQPHPVLDPAPPGLVLFNDPFVPEGEGYATFLSFFKLAQDVAAFRETAKQQAPALDLTPEEAEASIIGRHRNGTPLLPGRDPNGAATLDNRFDYSTDPEGRVCPFASHVRKMNQRDGQHPRTRIVRRAMPYGPAWREKEAPGIERGLLFMSYQSSFFSTLRVLIEDWANSADFPRQRTGMDLVISYSGSARLPSRRDAVSTSMERFVQFVGGALFFVPSPAFFEKF